MFEAPDSVKSTWYQAIHDILPTNERLATIGLTDTSSCVHCGNLNSLQHRIVACGEDPVIWHWTRTRITAILRMDPRRVIVEWTLRPDFQLWPPQRQTAVIWILAHLVAYSLQSSRRLSLLDYMDFLRRARWRLYNGTRRSMTGKCLDILYSRQGMMHDHRPSYGSFGDQSKGETPLYLNGRHT